MNVLPGGMKRLKRKGRTLLQFRCENCGDTCFCETSEADDAAWEDARNIFGDAPVDLAPERFMTVCGECYEELIEQSLEACSQWKNRSMQ